MEEHKARIRGENGKKEVTKGDCVGKWGEEYVASENGKKTSLRKSWKKKMLGSHPTRVHSPRKDLSSGKVTILAWGHAHLKKALEEDRF